MNLFRKVMGGKTLPPVEEPDLEAEIRQMAKSEDAVAREDEKSGLVALYPELGASRRRRRRGFADLDDLDDYVPELDDYEPGLEGEYLPPDEHRAAETPYMAPPAEPQQAPARAPLEPPSRADREAHGDHAATPNYRLEHASRPDEQVETGQTDAAPRQAGTPAAAVAPVEPDDAVEDEDAPQGLVRVPAPAVGRAGGRRAGRVKTRLLGFGQSAGGATDPFESAQAAASSGSAQFPVGWIVVLEGPGRGASFTLFDGVSAIGRGEDQPVRLDFGDTSISRSTHAVVAFDNEQRKFFLGHGGKANLVRLNGKPVLSTEELNNNDKVRIGETTLRFIALCGPDFDWTADDGTPEVDAASA